MGPAESARELGARKSGKSRRGADRVSERTGAAASQPALEVALRRLEEIAAQLEGGSLDLETSLKLYREARELHASCVARLAEVEREARILTEAGVAADEILEGGAREVPEQE